MDQKDQLFRRVVSALNQVIEKVPNSVVVIACLEDFYQQMKAYLTAPLIERLEHDPDAMRLEAYRNANEVRDLISTRLKFMFESLNVDFDASAPTFPIPDSEISKWQGRTTRYVLESCRKYRQTLFNGPFAKESSPDIVGISALWEKHLAEHRATPPVTDEDQARLLAQSLDVCDDESSEAFPRYEACATGRFVELEIHGTGNSVCRRLIGICNRDPRGGGLKGQIEEVDRRADTFEKALVRSMDFPSKPGTETTRMLLRFSQKGGLMVVVSDSAWRSMAAYQQFAKENRSAPGFDAWRQAERPLSRLECLRQLLNLVPEPKIAGNRPAAGSPVDRPLETSGPDESSNAGNPKSTVTDAATPKTRESTGKEGQSARPSTQQRDTSTASSGSEVSPDSAMTKSPRTAAPADLSTPLIAGRRQGLNAAAVEVPPAQLTRHAAFLGGTGSGKTTVALNLLEQLLLRCVPAVLVDRKGDLCRYADPAWWEEEESDPLLAARKQQLRQRIVVDLYTPGSLRGRPLGLSIVPAGISRSEEFDDLAKAATAALAEMCGLKSSPAHQAQQAALLLTVKQIARLIPDREATLQDLIDLAASQDADLIEAMGNIDPKHLNSLVQLLEVRKTTCDSLFNPQIEKLSVERLLSPGEQGRTRLSIISTKFLRDGVEWGFWITQFLNELRRWISRRPSSTLQAVVLFDEADKYLPATSQPATKAPLEDLLKRARSGGLGIFLATQSPGDMDYKCRENLLSWWIGKVKENTALEKLKAVLSAAKISLQVVPQQATGEFHLAREGQVDRVQADRSAMQTRQLGEDEILRLAQDARSASTARR